MQSDLTQEETVLCRRQILRAIIGGGVFGALSMLILFPVFAESGQDQSHVRIEIGQFRVARKSNELVPKQGAFYQIAIDKPEWITARRYYTADFQYFDSVIVGEEVSVELRRQSRQGRARTSQVGRGQMIAPNLTLAEFLSNQTNQSIQENPSDLGEERDPNDL